MTKDFSDSNTMKQQDVDVDFIIDAAELATWNYNTDTKKFSGNKRCKEWFYLPTDEDMDFDLALTRIAEADRKLVFDAIKNAIQSPLASNYNMEYTLVNPDDKSERRVNAIGKSVFNEKDELIRFSGLMRDITGEWEAREKLREAEERARIAVDAGLLGTFDVDYVSNKIIYSPRLLEIFGVQNDLDRPDLVQRIHPDDLPIRAKAFEVAIQTGNLVYEARVIWPDQSIHWMYAQGKVFKNAEGKPARIIGTVKDNTDQKKLFLTTQENEEKFRNTVKQAPIGITILTGPTFIVEMANENYLQIVDKKEEQFVGRSLFESLPEVREFVEGLLKDVYTTGKPFYGLEFPVYINRHGKQELAYFNFVYQALRDKHNIIYGIIVVASDVTASVKAKHTLAESEKQFRNLIMQSPIPMAIFRGRDYVIELGNTIMFEKMWRRKQEDIQGKKLLDVFPELYAQKYPELLDKVFTTGIPHREKESIAFVQGDDGMKRFYLDYEYAPLFETDNSISGIMITVNDVTEKVEARQKIQEAEERARLAITTSELGVYEIDLNTHELITDERFLEILGKSGTDDWKNIVNMIHPDDKKIRDDAFASALKNGLLDYEARFIKDDNEIVWIKIKGKLILNNDAPLKILGIGVDITKQKEFEAALENKVQERTQELAEVNRQLHQSNIELNQFAYIASHDLQEPLRKVRTFVELMSNDLGVVSEKSAVYISKIQTSTERMQKLINDVLKFSLLSKEREKFEQVDLNIILKNIVSDYELLIEQKNATINAETLPVIEAIPLQMSQLFTNLISNALKFSDKERQLKISITADKLSEDDAKTTEGLLVNESYYKIEFKDNGIGFEQENAEQIFTIFQRLHGKAEYEGTGIGLAMCKKIVQNHHGIINAHSGLNQGATFTIILPKEQEK